ncbi:hypothetical protein ACFPRL_14225 [Pseudoclavibacter helvolus]
MPRCALLEGRADGDAGRTGQAPGPTWAHSLLGCIRYLGAVVTWAPALRCR